MSAKPVPDGYHSITPYLVVDGAAEAIAFYNKAFGAIETMRLDAPGGKVGHAEIRIGDSAVMLADEFPEMDYRGPKAFGGCAMSLLIYTDDVDAMFQRAVDEGATVVKPLADQFYGDRNGTLKDPFGHTWSIATRKEDLSPEEINRRYEEMMQAHGG